MPDDKVVLALFPSPAPARALAVDLGAAVDARLSYLRAHDDVHVEALTPPLEELAQQNGFAWDADD